jgi:hypothetical protein
MKGPETSSGRRVKIRGATTAAKKSIDPNDAATRAPAVVVKSGSI